MSIASELATLIANKAAIKAAIEAKSPTVAPTNSLAQWPDAIASIPTGGGGASVVPKPTVFVCNNFTSFTDNFQGALTSSNLSSILQSHNVAITSIIAIAFGSGITSIGDSLFENSSVNGHINLIDIPSSVTSIGSRAFIWSHICSLDIPESVTSIGDGCFTNSSNLANVIIRASGELSIGDGAFQMCASTFTLRLPNQTVAQTQAMNPTLWFGWATMTVTVICSDGSFTLTISCLAKGTDILLSDGTTKKIESLTYDDTLKVWDFDEGRLGVAKVCWLTKPGLKSNHYYQLTFDDGTVLKTTGINSNHRIYSADQNKFTNVSDVKVGDRVFSVGGVLTITDVKYVEEQIEYYNVITSQKINCFANGILTSDRYGNMYPIDSSMRYVKDGRAIRPYSDYEAVGISRYWYDHLRLGEVPESIEKTQEYIRKCEGQMLPLPSTIVMEASR